LLPLEDVAAPNLEVVVSERLFFGAGPLGGVKLLILDDWKPVMK
jgi:hypothetical protein